MVMGTQRDIDSIMMYAIPEEFTLDGFSSSMNFDFSIGDIEFLSSVYPKAKPVEPDSVDETEVEVTTNEVDMINVIKIYVETFLNNNPKSIDNSPAKTIKTMASILGIEYDNKVQTSIDIVEFLKKYEA